MRWPALVPRALCKTPIQVTLRREGIDEDGAPVAALTVETVCNWQDSAKTVRTDQEHFVELASRDIDTLTFNRIRALGFDALTEFQQEIIQTVTCQLADFRFENDELLDSALTGYSINGVSANFGDGRNVVAVGEVILPVRLYGWLQQTGLCCRRLG